MLRNLLSSFIVLFILSETRAQAFQFLAPPSVKAELATNEWVIKGIPPSNHLFDYGDYQLKHLPTGAIVHIVQRPDTVVWNPEVTSWQEWLYKGAKKTTFLFKEELKLNDFTLFQFNINDSLQNIGAIKTTPEGVNILVHCFLSPKKKIQKQQILAFRSLISTLSIWSTSDFDKHFGYPLNPNLLYCGKLDEKLKQRAMEGQPLHEKIESHIIWNNSVNPPRIEVDATNALLSDLHSCGYLDELLLPEKRSGFTYQTALKEFNISQFRKYDLTDCYDYFLGIKKDQRPLTFKFYAFAASEYAKKLENEKRKLQNKFVPTTSLSFPDNDKPERNIKWMTLLNDSVGGFCAYNYSDGMWIPIREFNFPNTCSIRQGGSSRKTWRYGDYFQCYFSNEIEKAWVVVENRNDTISEDTLTIGLPAISVFSRAFPNIEPLALHRIETTDLIKQSFLAEINRPDKSESIRINCGLSIYNLFVPNDLISAEMGSLSMQSGFVSYLLLNKPRTIRSNTPVILPPDQRIYHLPSFATDLNKNGFTEVWIASISNGTIVHLDIVEETDQGFTRIPSSDQWINLISSITEVQIIQKDSKRTEDHFHTSEDLGGSNFPIAIEEELATEVENYEPQEPLVIPEFPGGDAAMYQFIQKNLVYPKALKKAGIKGTVFVKAIVDPKGKIKDAAIWEKRGVSPELDKEAIRIVSSFPNWKTFGNYQQIIVPITFE